MQQFPAWRSEPLWLLASLGALSVLLAVRNPTLSTGSLLVLLAALFLVQTLVRDLVILNQLRRQPAGADGIRHERCFCLETPLGMVFLVVALGIYWTGFAGQGIHPWLAICLGVAATLLANYLMRDLVIRWRPLGIRRDPSHFNIIPRS